MIAEKIDSITRLERIYSNVLRLKGKLSSYACEPKTYAMFEKLDKLKIRLELLCISLLKLMKSLKNEVHFKEVQKQQINENKEEAEILEKAVLSYIKEAAL